MSKYKADRRNCFFFLCYIIMGTSEAKSLLSKRKKFTYLCSQQEEELLGKISANHQLVCLSALSEPRTHSGDSKASFFNLYRLSYPAQVHAKANLLCRLTGELLVAPRELCWELGSISLPFPAGNFSSTPAQGWLEIIPVQTPQLPAQPEWNHPTCSLHLPDPTAVRKAPIQAQGQTPGSISPLHPRELLMEAREAASAHRDVSRDGETAEQL